MSLNLVLDTNVVLDWLVFYDARLNQLRKCIETGDARVLTHPLVIAELTRVLNYEQLNLQAAKQLEVLAEYETLTSLPTVRSDFSRQQLFLPQGFPRCRDPDDDVFLALAFHAQANCLISRDKEILRLKRRVQKFDVHIIDVAALQVALSPEPS